MSGSHTSNEHHEMVLPSSMLQEFEIALNVQPLLKKSREKDCYYPTPFMRSGSINNQVATSETFTMTSWPRVQSVNHV